MKTNICKGLNILMLPLLTGIFLLGAARPGLAQDPPPAGAGDKPVNTGFETGGEGESLPPEWNDQTLEPPTGGLGYQVTIDGQVARSGSRSARIRFVGPYRSPWGYGTITQSFRADTWRGKRIRLSGYIKTDQVTGAGAQLWLRVDGRYGILADDSMTDRMVTGTFNWVECTCVLDVSEKATAIVFGAALEGNGTMWVDDLVIESVGDDVPSTAEFRTVDDDPRPEAIEWLKINSVPFTSAEAGQGFDDLEPVRAMIGEAKIVALGEGTHGTREFFQMKHRLVEFLASEMGFTIFSIEASTPEAYRLNDYVLGGDGDPAALIAGMYFWTWRTEEVLAMVEWMREFNASGRGRIQFTGFDMQTPDLAMRIAKTFLKTHDPKLYYLANKNYGLIMAGQTTRQNFGLATMKFPVEAARGKKVRYSGYIKTVNVQNGWAGLWWRVDSKTTNAIAFDNMKDRGPAGTTEWAHYEIVLEVADEASNINFGVIMPGEGRAWFDGLTVELDGDIYSDPELFDFDFEKPSIYNYYASNSGSYRATLDSTVAHSGKQSLCLEKVDAPPEERPDPAVHVTLAQEVMVKMRAARDSLAAAASAWEADWAIHNATIVEQCMRQRLGDRPETRDQAMAKNVGWILDQNPGTKIVLWAHNGHIERNRNRMGEFLDARYGESYLPIGFAAGAGDYVAFKGNELGENPMPPAPSGSIESYFMATNKPRLILDLRREGEETATSWLGESRLFRSIGAMATPYQFFPAVISDRFDLLIYFRDTTPAVQLDFKTSN